jgi:3-oxoacyl-[acyl-carrier-protein] synthase-3
MNGTICSVITGTGNYIPSLRIRNEDFLSNEFYDTNGKKLEKTNREIIDDFLEITTIAERRHVTDDLVTSDIACFAASDAIKSANIDKEELDCIIFAHNFGDAKNDIKKSDILPSLASRVKQKLEIKNPDTIAYDLLIQADHLIKSGDAGKVLVIGADILSRFSDPSDRDSMLYADGAGAAIIEARRCDHPIGILAAKTRSDTLLNFKTLYLGKSNKPDNGNPLDIFIKMNGRKVYQYAIEKVPQLIKDCLEKSNTHLSDVKKVLIHQANGKMNDAILKRLFGLYNIADVPEDIMPMTISWLGNSSVATIPTLLDLILKDQIKPHKIIKGDTLVFASVGAGMSVNALIYKV